MGFRDIVQWIRARQADGIVAVPVAAIDDAEADDRDRFVPGDVYLEVRLAQVWLTNERELWREFQPCAAVVTEVLRQGSRTTVPAVLAASELQQRMSRNGAADAIEISNVRVAGPLPYEGDDVGLLLTLFRTTTADWLNRTLQVVADVTRSLGVAGLAPALGIGESVVRAIETLFGLEEMELRVGQYQSWSAPTGDGFAARDRTELQPSHFAVIRRPRREATESELAALRVRDGRLYRLVGQQLVPYVEHDFILVKIASRAVRDDYRQLEFYRLWQDAQQDIVDGDLQAASRAWRRTVGALYTDELTRRQQELLYQEYHRRYSEMVDRFQELGGEDRWRSASGRATSRGEPGNVAAHPIQLDDEDPADIIRRAQRA